MPISISRRRSSTRFIRPSRGSGARKGRRGQRLVEAPGANDNVYGFGLVDWCEGWCDGRLAPGRTADIFCAQVRAAVARSRARGRMAIVRVDNLRTQTPAGSKLVRQMLAELQDQLGIIYTPAYDPGRQPDRVALALVATGGHP